MDTIVYLCYKHRAIKQEENSQSFCSYDMTEHIRKDYRVIKIRIVECEETPVELSEPSHLHVLARMRRKRSKRKQRERQQEARQKAVQAIQQELVALLQEWDENMLCYDGAVPQDCWVRRILPFWELQEFTEHKWVERLLEEGRGHHFIVLGESSCIKQILWELSSRMKSLLWVIAAQGHEESLEEFAEEFYLETGLAMQLQIVPEKTSYGRYRLPGSLSQEPVTVLDFLVDNRLPDLQLPKGSVWLDMTSNEDKERRIVARGWTCKVISLRKQWKNL